MSYATVGHVKYLIGMPTVGHGHGVETIILGVADPPCLIQKLLWRLILLFLFGHWLVRLGGGTSGNICNGDAIGSIVP